MKKKGISTIIATVLTVLITVASVVILWASVQPIIKERLYYEDLDLRFTIDPDGTYTVYDPENGFLKLRLSRGSDTAEVIGLKFVINSQGNTVSRETYNVVSQNSALVYYMVFEKGLQIDSVSVVPIYIREGEEVEGQPTDVLLNLVTRPGSLRYLIDNNNLEIAFDGESTNENVNEGTESNENPSFSFYNLEFDQENGLLGMQVVRNLDNEELSQIEFNIKSINEGSNILNIKSDDVLSSSTTKTYFLTSWPNTEIEQLEVIFYDDTNTEFESYTFLGDEINQNADFSSELGDLPITYDESVKVTDGLVLFYDFDEMYVSSDNNQIDLSGNNFFGKIESNNEIINNVGSEQTIYFDSMSYVSINDPGRLNDNLPNERTFVFWTAPIIEPTTSQRYMPILTSLSDYWISIRNYDQTNIVGNYYLFANGYAENLGGNYDWVELKNADDVIVDSGSLSQMTFYAITIYDDGSPDYSSKIYSGKYDEENLIELTQTNPIFYPVLIGEKTQKLFSGAVYLGGGHISIGRRNSVYTPTIGNFDRLRLYNKNLDENQLEEIFDYEKNLYS